MRWWRGDRKVPLIFGAYGLAMGLLTFSLNIFDGRHLEYVVLQLNFPATMILLYVEWNIANPNGLSILFHPIMLAAGSIIAWSFIGLPLYLLVRMFKMGP